MSEWIDFELKEATTKIGSGATPEADKRLIIKKMGFL